MGASLARAAKQAAPDVRVVAVEPREDVRALALRDAVADVALAEPGPALAGCELAVLCTPIAALEALLAPVSRLLPDGAVLTDVGGAKERVVARAARDVRPGVAFVGAHPMFGGHGGYVGARADLWRGGAVAVCVDAPPEAVETVARFHTAPSTTLRWRWSLTFRTSSRARWRWRRARRVRSRRSWPARGSRT